MAWKVPGRPFSFSKIYDDTEENIIIIAITNSIKVIPINLGPKAGNGFNPQSFPSAPKVVKFITPMAHKYSKNTLKTIKLWHL